MTIDMTGRVLLVLAAWMLLSVHVKTSGNRPPWVAWAGFARAGLCYALAAALALVAALGRLPW